jgi:antitoxin ParD1/3/4/toxin ParE1/3/4
LEIWRRIAEDSVDLANRIDGEFHRLFASLARAPGQGHARKELARRPILFFPLYSFLVVYQPGVQPLRILAVLRGTRNGKHPQGAALLAGVNPRFRDFAAPRP